nr:MAG TPA: hypothetical protein [Caudoviricetes sp.]
MGKVFHARFCKQFLRTVRCAERRQGGFPTRCKRSGITAYRFTLDFCIISRSTGKGLHGKRLRRFDDRIRVHKRAATHLYRIKIGVVRRFVAGVVVEEGTGPHSQSRKIFLAHGSHIGAGVVCIISVDHAGLPPLSLRLDGNSGSAGLRAVLLGLGRNGDTGLSLSGVDSQQAVFADLGLRAILAPLDLAVDNALAGNSSRKRLAVALCHRRGSGRDGNSRDVAALAVNRERERICLFRVVGVDGVRDLPAETHDCAQRDHIVLHEVVNDVLRCGVLNHALGEDLEGHVLTNGIDKLAPIADDHLRLRRIERAVHGEVHIHAVQTVAGSALHIGLENRLTGSVAKAAQLTAHLDSGHNAVGVETVQLNLGNQAAIAHDVGVNIRTDGNAVASGNSGRHNAIAPSAGLVRAKQDSCVDDLAESLSQTGLDLAPNVIIRIIESGLGNGNDDRDFLGVQLLLVPRHLGGLLECLTCAAVSGFAIDKVCGGKCIKHVDSLRLAGHIRQSATHTKDGRFGDSALHDFAGYRFRDKAGKCGTINTCHVVISFSLLECAADQIVHRGIGICFLFAAANSGRPVDFYAVLKRGRIGADLRLVPFVKPIKRTVLDFKVLCFQVCQICLFRSLRAEFHALFSKRLTNHVCVVIIGNLGLVALDLLFERFRFRAAVRCKLLVLLHFRVQLALNSRKCLCDSPVELRLVGGVSQYFIKSLNFVCHFLFSFYFHSVIPRCVLQQKSQPVRNPYKLAPIALSRALLRGSAVFDCLLDF